MRIFSRLLLISLSMGFISHVQAQQPDTFSVYFDLNIPTLNSKAKEKINELIYRERIPRTGTIKIVGYADYLGTEDDNQTLSENRAKSVQDYLTQFYVRKENIRVCIGRGEVARKGMKDVTGMPVDRRVDIVINAPPDADTVTTLRITGKRSPSIDIDKYTPGQALVLEKMFFYPERHTLRPESEPQLERLYITMRDNPKLKIRIEGHVCCVMGHPDAIDIDTKDGCVCLSVNRAKAIYEYLVKKGIAKERMKYAGYGRSKPLVAVEKSYIDEDKNRRVEIRILEK